MVTVQPGHERGQPSLSVIVWLLMTHPLPPQIVASQAARAFPAKSIAAKTTPYSRRSEERPMATLPGWLESRCRVTVTTRKRRQDDFRIFRIDGRARTRRVYRAPACIPSQRVLTRS